MCIRDRDGVAAGQQAQVDFGQRAATDERRPPPDAEHLARVCLLYTSDAADERSSVDLGGRRIINKKKNKKKTTTTKKKNKERSWPQHTSR